MGHVAELLHRVGDPLRVCSLTFSSPLSARDTVATETAALAGPHHGSSLRPFDILIGSLCGKSHRGMHCNAFAGVM